MSEKIVVHFNDLNPLWEADGLEQAYSLDNVEDQGVEIELDESELTELYEALSSYRNMVYETDRRDYTILVQANVGLPRSLDEKIRESLGGENGVHYELGFFNGEKHPILRARYGSDGDLIAQFNVKLPQGLENALNNTDLISLKDMLVPNFYDKEDIENMLDRDLSDKQWEVLRDKLPGDLAEEISRLVYEKAEKILNANMSLSPTLR